MANAPQKVATIWRYPVKSMMGEELNASEITAHGVHGDRAFALIDVETGKVVSAKNPQKWPNIFYYRAAYSTPPHGATLPPIRITMPCGKSLLSDASNANDELSAALNRKVALHSAAPEQPTLEQFWPEFAGQANEVSQEAVAGDAPRGTFYDYATLHLLTTASLTKLGELYPEGRFEARRFRPNIVVDTGDQKGFVENDWVGKTIRIGDTVRLHVTDPCPRCIMPTLAQGDLPRDLGVLNKGIMQNRINVPFAGKSLPSIGVYARVIAGGAIRYGDAIVIEG
jgi:uncharacterized protein YcbX